METVENKMRIIQEFVPGKQITIAHLIANPDGALYKALNVKEQNAIGVIAATPAESALIIGDIAVKASGAVISKINLETGTLILNGKVSQIEAALNEALSFSKEKLEFTVCELTKS